MNITIVGKLQVPYHYIGSNYRLEQLTAYEIVIIADCTSLSIRANWDTKQYEVVQFTDDTLSISTTDNPDDVVELINIIAPDAVGSVRCWIGDVEL